MPERGRLVGGAVAGVVVVPSIRGGHFGFLLSRCSLRRTAYALSGGAALLRWSYGTAMPLLARLRSMNLARAAREPLARDA